MTAHTAIDYCADCGRRIGGSASRRGGQWLCPACGAARDRVVRGGVALLTAADLRRALEQLDTAVVSRAIAREAEPLADLAQLVALAAPGDRARRQAVLTALATGLRALGGEGWRGLAGQEAIGLVRRAMDAAGDITK